MKHNLQLVNFQTSDGLFLPGLLYEPEKKTEKVAIFLHGNGSSSIFYNADYMNLYGEYLNKIGISFFPFNNRGAHWIKKLNRTINGEKERVKYGMTYELIKEAILDIDGAIDFLKKLGYKTFYLIGESTGASKIVVYNYYRRKNPVSKYILLAGGDDLSIYYKIFGRKKFFEVLNKCRKEITQGNGAELVPNNILPDEMISYHSFYDMINPEGDYNVFPFNEYLNNLKISKKILFREFKTINKPTLAIYGELDEFCYGRVNDSVSILKKEAVDLNLFKFKIIKDADHGFHGKEKELINVIANWLLG